VSIDEVRTLVGERQRYDDWLGALEARRGETPARVFDRVFGDYRARRAGVMSQLREHVPALAALGDSLDARLHALEERLGTLEDERAEAMLRTAVGEFDSDRWEQVRVQVETQIGELGESRASLLAEVDEVRTLLASARSEPEADEAADEGAAEQQPEAALASHDHDADAAEAISGESIEAHDASDVASSDTEDPSHHTTADASAFSHEASAPNVSPTMPIAEPEADSTMSATDPFGIAAIGAAAAAPHEQSAEELRELDDALALFSTEPTSSDAFSSTTRGGTPAAIPPAIETLDVFDDTELGDLRMSPPVTATATATPTASPVSGGGSGADVSRDGFDDLAFLRSVVDPTSQSGMVRAPASGEQQKTLRCTECGTMNFPTEWYCERCGGELAAF
jgi:hypothetical protein